MIDGYEPIVENIWNSKDALNEGDFITGEYLGSEPGYDTPEMKISARYFLRRDGDEKKWLVWGSKVLDQAMKEIRMGEEICIMFKGKKNLKGARKLNIYEVGKKATKQESID